MSGQLQSNHASSAITIFNIRRSDAANPCPAASNVRLYLPFCSFVIVMPAVARSASN